LDADRTFPKSERLRWGYEFRRVFQSGRKAEGALLAVYVLEAPAAAVKRRAVGIVTGRRLGGAVQRNRARRLLREAYRLNKQKLKPNIELVMVARPAILGKRLEEVETELLKLCRAAGALAQS
jgi:ribonuclease P protein component